MAGRARWRRRTPGQSVASHPPGQGPQPGHRRGARDPGCGRGCLPAVHVAKKPLWGLLCFLPDEVAAPREKILDGNRSRGASPDSEPDCVGISLEECGHATLRLGSAAFHLNGNRLRLIVADEIDFVLPVSPPLNRKALFGARASRYAPMALSMRWPRSALSWRRRSLGRFAVAVISEVS